MRTVHPFEYEQLAATATAYTNSTMELADQLEDIEKPDEKARAITATAAVLVNYLHVVDQLTGVDQDHDENLDDTPPDDGPHRTQAQRRAHRRRQPRLHLPAAQHEENQPVG